MTHYKTHTIHIYKTLEVEHPKAKAKRRTCTMNLQSLDILEGFDDSL